MHISYLEIGVSRLERSLDLYAGMLGFPVVESTVDTVGRRVAILGTGPGLRLVELGPAARPTGWDPDDRQRGIRHFGMKVADIDAWARRLAAAGVPFALDPVDAFGEVRIAFFFDPDGTYLELVQGYVQHNNLWSAALAEAEVDGDRGWDGSPRFDHIAVTVPDVDDALRFYTGLGFAPIGQLVRPTEPRGFLITNLRAGAATLEVFTFTDPTFPGPASESLGLRAIAIDGLPSDELGPGEVPLTPVR